MSRIVTFYSYKGGVGRTSTMANVAVLLARYGKNVLLMDWDLEAPGLDRYFKPYIKAESKPSRGVIQMLAKAAKEPTPAWEPFVTRIKIDGCPPISIIMSGDRSTDYIEQIRAFSWSDFFENRQGGAILDRWRKEWKSKYDYVLVDSRTGITDVGGVCTVFLPDILVFVFVANEQSFECGLEVVNSIQQARRNLAVPRAPLAVLPLPGRFDGRDEVDEASAWLDRFSRGLKPFYDDWLPKQFEPRRILELTKVPYITKFSFGERLAILEHNTSDPEFPGFYLDNVARLIASDFADALQILAPGTNLYDSTISEIRSKLTKSPIDEVSLDHLLTSFESRFGNSAKLRELLNDSGVALLRLGRFEFAETCFRRALANVGDLVGSKDPIALFSMINLGHLTRRQGKLDEAEDLYREVLKRNPTLSRAYVNLADLLREKGNLTEAEDLYREALKRNPALSRAYMNLATLLRERGNLTEAEDLYREAVHVFEKISKSGSAELAEAQSNLAEILVQTGNLNEAISLKIETLAMLERIRDKEHPAVVRAKIKLGRLCLT